MTEIIDQLRQTEPDVLTYEEFEHFEAQAYQIKGCC